MGVFYLSKTQIYIPKLKYSPREVQWALVLTYSRGSHGLRRAKLGLSQTGLLALG